MDEACSSLRPGKSCILKTARPARRGRRWGGRGRAATAEKTLEKSSPFRRRCGNGLGTSHARLARGHPPLGIRRLLDVRFVTAARHLYIGAGRAGVVFIFSATHV